MSTKDEQLMSDEYWDKVEIEARVMDTIARICPELVQMIEPRLMEVVATLMMACLCEGRADTLRQFAVEAHLVERQTNIRFTELRAEIMRRRRTGLR